MGVEIVAIGNEVLNGFVFNTNASYIAQQLLIYGFKTERHTVLPDNIPQLEKDLQEVMLRSRIVIITGGLGPTCDDLTRTVVAHLFSTDLYYNDELAVELKARYGNRLISLRDQATVIKNALLLKNPIGTASGFVLESKKSTFILLPGVPAEMKLMLNEQVIPYLITHFPPRLRKFWKQIHFFGLSEALIDPELRLLKEKYSEVDFGIYASQGTLAVEINLESNDSSGAEKKISKIETLLLTKFKNNHFDVPTGKIEEAIHHLFLEKKITLSLAESCTGGALAAKLIAIPKASKYFIGSLVTYSNELKTKLLGVSEALLNQNGAISKEVVDCMVTKVQQITNSEWSVAISGIAGPTGGTKEKPVGTVWASILQKGHVPFAFKLQCTGNRQMIIERTCNLVLGELLKRVRSV
jgi:nicotinamide-nucleotide amidase